MRMEFNACVSCVVYVIHYGGQIEFVQNKGKKTGVLKIRRQWLCMRSVKIVVFFYEFYCVVETRFVYVLSSHRYAYVSCVWAREG